MSTTPPYVIAVKADKGSVSPLHWKTQYYGRPNAKNLAKVIEHYNASTEPGECNAHLGGMKITAAELIKQETGNIVATFTA